MAFKIIWRPQKMTFFKYGGVLRYVSYGVEFRHEQLSPGCEVVSWSSLDNHFESRGSLQLPLLERGCRYHLSFQGRVEPAGSVLVKVEFFNRVSEPVGYCFTALGEGDFAYPKSAYGYKISLFSQGLKALTFEHLLLQKIEQESL